MKRNKINILIVLLSLRIAFVVEAKEKKNYSFDIKTEHHSNLDSLADYSDGTYTIEPINKNVLMITPKFIYNYKIFKNKKWSLKTKTDASLSYLVNSGLEGSDNYTNRDDIDENLKHLNIAQNLDASFKLNRNFKFNFGVGYAYHDGYGVEFNFDPSNPGYTLYSTKYDKYSARASMRWRPVKKFLTTFVYSFSVVDYSFDQAFLGSSVFTGRQDDLLTSSFGVAPKFIFNKSHSVQLQLQKNELFYRNRLPLLEDGSGQATSGDVDAETLEDSRGILKYTFKRKDLSLSPSVTQSGREDLEFGGRNYTAQAFGINFTKKFNALNLALNYSEENKDFENWVVRGGTEKINDNMKSLSVSLKFPKLIKSGVLELMLKKTDTTSNSDDNAIKNEVFGLKYNLL